MNLKATRLDEGLTGQEMAEKIGISSSTYNRAESGFGVRPKHAKQIADYFGVKPSDIWPVEQTTTTAA